MTELTRPTRTIVNVPDGMQPLILARLVEERLKSAADAGTAAVFVARSSTSSLVATHTKGFWWKRSATTLARSGFAAE